MTERNQGRTMVKIEVRRGQLSEGKLSLTSIWAAAEEPMKSRRELGRNLAGCRVRR